MLYGLVENWKEFTVLSIISMPVTINKYIYSACWLLKITFAKQNKYFFSVSSDVYKYSIIFVELV